VEVLLSYVTYLSRHFYVRFMLEQLLKCYQNLMQLKYGIDGWITKGIYHYLWQFPQFIVKYHVNNLVIFIFNYW